MIDLYCERTAAGFWNEPFNALSNAAFVIASLHAWHLRSRRGRGDLAEAVVILLAGLIGVGSFLFHTLANRWAELADIIPIWSFVAAYVLLTIHRLTGERLAKTMRIALISAAIALLITRFTGDSLISSAGDAQALPLNGSLQYAPALTALLIFTLLAWWRSHAMRQSLAIATALFCLALFFRTIDLVVCPANGAIGTHFLWHLFNGLMVWVLLSTLVEKLPPIRP